ncbi:MAG: hypothetical protein JWO81_2151 [Alphaproteobacteria bacterium]|nr:hypothetical protein [Alphaproteobacteria bacterium]
MPLDLHAALAARGEVPDIWADPKRLPSGLLAVRPFEMGMLPAPLIPWVSDIVGRMQVPAEFVAVPAIIGAGALIGRKIGIRPQEETDWHETPNLWGAVIGRPGVIKSPAMQEGLKPINRLQAEARRQFAQQNTVYEASALERELRGDARKQALKNRFKLNPKADASDLAQDDDPKPTLKRYVANDSSYQSLGELLIENQNGILVHRDEIMSLLRNLDREDNVEARGFYLTGWNGTDDYTFDRIIRGKNLHVPSLTISVIGSTQPGKIREYISSAIRGGASDDGMIQRFSLMVWPDIAPDYTEQDRPTDGSARHSAYQVFDWLDNLTAPKVGARVDPLDERRPYLRFDSQGLGLFREWRQGHEKRLRSGDLHPALESHLAKYRKLVPVLALIHHLCSRGNGSVPEMSVLAALAWAEYLESHAHRIYFSAIDNSADAAREIIRRLRSGDLPPRFGAREILRKGWSGLANKGAVADALDLLEDHHWVQAVDIPSGMKGGRPTVAYIANPKGLR